MPAELLACTLLNIQHRDDSNAITEGTGALISLESQLKCR
jgi:hypothetical protein